MALPPLFFSRRSAGVPTRSASPEHGASEVPRGARKGDVVAGRDGRAPVSVYAARVSKLACSWLQLMDYLLDAYEGSRVSARVVGSMRLGAVHFPGPSVVP